LNPSFRTTVERERSRPTVPDAGGLRIRRGRPEDTRACHELMWHAATDLGMRRGTPLDGTADDWWNDMRAVHEQLEANAAEWWVAELDGVASTDSGLIGYARSMQRGGLVELTEFFVRPGRQSAGLGRELLSRAFPAGRGEVRSIIATTDERALRRYYGAGVVARFPFLSLSAEPGDAPGPDGLHAERITGVRAIGAVIDVERAVLGYPRGEREIRVLLREREGWLYRRGTAGDVAGYAFLGARGSGPMATLEPHDLPGVLLHVESRARALGMAKLELEVPSVAETAVRHLLGRGYRISPWLNLLMSDHPFGQFDRFIGFSPPLFL
jgi:GNAT superfamily N-acetyltransferase